MKITAEPRSDQWNADDFIGGPRTFTVAGVKVGSAEQKYDIELVEGEGRVWRPPLTVLRILMAAWGDEADVWTGRRVQLYRDESVRFGPDAVGGIRIGALSDLPGGKPLKVKVTEKRGKRALHTVEPLTDTAPTSLPSKPAPTREQIAACTDVEQLNAWAAEYQGPRRDAALARLAEVTTPDPWTTTAAQVTARDEEETA